MKLAIKENAQENKYQLLGRLVSDCKYYLGGGYGAEKHLWAKSVEDQIAKMKEIYNSLDVKPEWLTMQDIEHYEKEMKKVKSSKNESLSIAKTIKEQKADIEVENPGILEVPEGKNVEDLPIKHFVDIANRKGLATVTRALNNLQVWNKNKNKSLSKWAGDMIDKVNKRFENQKKNESLKRYFKEDNYKADDIDFIMNKYVDNKPVSGRYGSYDTIEIINNRSAGKYTVSCNGYSVDIDFDLDDDSAKYVYTIEGEGPYVRNSYEYIVKDIAHYIDWAVEHFDEDGIDESCCLKETMLPDWQDSIITEVENILNNNHIYADIYKDKDFDTNDSFMLCVEINDGDWKHEHKRADLIISDLLDNYDNISVTKMKEEVTDDSEDDTYSSIHKYMIIKSNDMTEDCCDEDILNEFSSNYADTEFDEMEYQSNILDTVRPEQISTTIEAQSSIPINIRAVDFEGNGDIVISYEVNPEDYDPIIIENIIINILERMENRMKESFNRRNYKESYDIDFDAITIPEDERYEYIKSKTVLDADGWQTEYTMYYDWEDDKYIFIFGDSDIYDPTNESPDWECDTEAEANEWFDNYTGFDDEEDFDECYLSETNNNTEEQELAEFLDWLKQEKIPVTDVNKKFKMIHIQNPDDLDMASWYLHDRDYFKKLADFGWMIGAPSPAGKKVAKALKMESKHKRINEHTYRVWYRPYLLDGDEEDYTDVTASNEDEARRKAGTSGWVVDVELLESKQLNEDETMDIENALQNFIDYNSNKNLDRIQKRIACTTEFDNGHVMHGDWQRIPVIDAELMAKEKSLKNPDKTYYVQYDDLMIGSSDLQWKNGQFKAW